MTKYPDYIPDYFQNLVNSSLVHSLPIPQISWKSSDIILSYPANKQTDKQTAVKTVPRQ